MRILDTGRNIPPFGDAVGALPFLGGTFAELRARLAADARVDPARLSFADHAIAAPRLLEGLRRRAPRGRPAALALPADGPSAALAPVSSVRRIDGRLVYDVFLDAPPGLGLEALRAAAEPVLVDLPTEPLRRELPRVGPGPHALILPADGLFAAHLEHWVHALWIAPLAVPLLRGRADNRIGRGAKIHPTAYLEGAVLGDGVKVGAGCSVRHSYVGEGSHLSDFTKLTHSVLGPATHTLADASFSWVVSMGGGTLANLLLRDTILGRGVFLTTGVIFWNESIDGPVAVEHDGHLVSTGRSCLGGAAGHGAILGARTIVAPGRALPNRITVVMRREESILAIDPVAPGTPTCWSDARLVDARGIGPVDEIEDRRAR